MTSRKNKAFSDQDIAKISDVYHNSRRIGGNYEEKVTALSESLKSHFEKSIELQERIKKNLLKVGIEI